MKYCNKPRKYHDILRSTKSIFYRMDVNILYDKPPPTTWTTVHRWVWLGGLRATTTTTTFHFLSHNRVMLRYVCASLLATSSRSIVYICRTSFGGKYVCTCSRLESPSRTIGAQPEHENLAPAASQYYSSWPTDRPIVSNLAGNFGSPSQIKSVACSVRSQFWRTEAAVAAKKNWRKINP